LLRLRCFGFGERLPQFEAVALGVGDPRESAEGTVFALRVDGNVRRAEFFEQPVEVIDAVVDAPPYSESWMPRCSAYQALRALGSRALRKMPPMPVTRAIENLRGGQCNTGREQFIQELLCSWAESTLRSHL
jgi:hypothetical protein